MDTRDSWLRFQAAVVAGDVEEARRLLAIDSSLVQGVGPGGRPFLHYGATLSHVEIVRLMLEAGADVDAVDSADETALHLAAVRGFVEVVRVLIAAGADVNARNLQGRTALGRVREVRGGKRHMGEAYNSAVEALLVEAGGSE